METFLPTHDILMQGRESDKVYILARGHVEVLVRTDKKMEKVRTLIPGKVFGELGVLCKCKRTATVSCWSYTNAANLSVE